MNADFKNGIDELQNLGFTNLESEIYVYLLGAGASSGYGIAQAISKPAANVYKAINTLDKKGAILLDEGNTRLCSAVPAEELLNALQRSFDSSKDRVGQFLQKIQVIDTDERIFRLKTPEQVYEKCESLIAQAEGMVLIDAFSATLDPLLDTISRTERRGVPIAVHSYDTSTFSRGRIFHNPAGRAVREKWSGNWLNIIVDSKSFIMAYFSQDMNRVLQAVWSNSPYISGVYHSALVAELQLSQLKSEMQKTSNIGVIQDVVTDMDQYFSSHQPVENSLLKMT